MTLLDWKSRPRTIMEEIQTILRANGSSNLSAAACREWAKLFVQHYKKDWLPGNALSFDHARLIGSAFERRYADARRRLRSRQ